jgi:hypothetical protein
MKIGEGQAYNPAYWNVYVQALNKYVYFNDQASASADVTRFGYGQLMGPNSGAGYSQVSSYVPASSTGWYKVVSGSRSWKFTDVNLAQRCAQATGGQIQASTAPDPTYANRANPQGPSYA